MDASGLRLFARYAYPPNLRGFCGPDDHQALLEYGTSGVVDPGLAELAKAFIGPMPYLKVMGEAVGIRDPFDRRLVEAYWVGSPILDRVDLTAFGGAMDERFRRQMGGGWGFFEETIPAGGVPHHSFHVFAVYPWVGMLRGERGEPLTVLDRCRIRWGTVVEADGETAVVRSRPLHWNGTMLTLGAEEAEVVRQATDGMRFIDPLQPGETVSLHWDWVCDRIDRRSLGYLQHYTARHLDMVNHRLAHPGPAMTMG